MESLEVHYNFYEEKCKYFLQINRKGSLCLECEEQVSRLHFTLITRAGYLDEGFEVESAIRDMKRRGRRGDWVWGSSIMLSLAQRSSSFWDLGMGG